MMKRIAIAIITLGVGALVASCSSHEKCPTYGKVNQTQIEQNA